MSHTPPERIAAIHDLSCFGRCALTVILPTLSAMGFQAVPLPTALLSTHTGGFDGLHFRDLTEDMDAIGAHFAELGLTFRSIYTGFLGSAAQIRTVEQFLHRFGTDAAVRPLILVDPVMGDDGVLYSTYTEELMHGMRALSRYADVLTPNLTEACFLCDTPYPDLASLSSEEALRFCEGLLPALTALGPRRVVITGIPLADGNLANVGVDETEKVFCLCKPHTGPSYPGTGDLFASVLLGELLRNVDFAAACDFSASYVGKVIAYSAQIDAPVRNGPSFEPLLGELTLHPRT